MKPEVRSLLWDIEQAAGSIARFIAGITLPDYLASEVIQAAVERKFEIIGEAMSRLAKADRALAAGIPRHREAIAFRNLLIHGTPPSKTSGCGAPPPSRFHPYIVRSP
jgi:uncharacterized protein with HEPN domain